MDFDTFSFVWFLFPMGTPPCDIRGKVIGITKSCENIKIEKRMNANFTL